MKKFLTTGLLAALLTAPLLAAPASAAPPNLLGTPIPGPNGQPACWQVYGWGENTYNAGWTYDLQMGGGIRLDVTSHKSGDRKFMPTNNDQCSVAVQPGAKYNLGLTYRNSVPASITVFTHSPATGWQYWTDLATLPATTGANSFQVQTPVIPAGVDRLIWGASISEVGYVVSTRYSMTKA
ncbi:hypothetical protein D5S17_25295 [Pseudonocardiaceae bacterium YIM PH 21723]|nr:hypothetical protein D5S17_25295 [Pseudonocardiaceae bacterium YIM PH 21723]